MTSGGAFPSQLPFGGGGLIRQSVYSLDFSNMPNGSLPVNWYAPSWAISGGKVINTPDAGSELLTNGNMETGNPPTGWTAGGTATLSGAADERTGGAGVQSLNVVRGGSASESVAVKSTSGGQIGWYRGEAWVKNLTADLLYMINPMWSASSTALTWAKLVTTRLITPAGSITATMRMVGASTEEGRYDDVSIKKITVADLFATLDQGLSDFNMVLPAMPDLAQGTQAGAVVCLDNAASPAGYVAVFYSNNQAVPSTTIDVVSFFGGTYTTLSSSSVSYGASKYISLKKTGDQLTVFYGSADFGTQIGSVVTIPAGLKNNTRHGLFSTCELVSFSGLFKFGRYIP